MTMWQLSVWQTDNPTNVNVTTDKMTNWQCNNCQFHNWQYDKRQCDNCQLTNLLCDTLFIAKNCQCESCLCNIYHCDKLSIWFTVNNHWQLNWNQINFSVCKKQNEQVITSYANKPTISDCDSIIKLVRVILAAFKIKNQHLIIIWFM